MGFKKFVAAALAAGFCMVSAVTPAKADISNVEVAVDWAEKDTDFVRFSAMGRDIDIADVYGIKITFTCADISGGVGGGLIINCDTNGWDQAEWGNDGAGKAITAVETGNADEYTVTRLLDAPVFQADNTYANFCLSHWWGGDIVITGAEFLGAERLLAQPQLPPVKFPQKHPRVMMQRLRFLRPVLYQALYFSVLAR